LHKLELKNDSSSNRARFKKCSDLFNVMTPQYIKCYNPIKILHLGYSK